MWLFAWESPRITYAQCKPLRFRTNPRSDAGPFKPQLDPPDLFHSTEKSLAKQAFKLRSFWQFLRILYQDGINIQACALLQNNRTGISKLGLVAIGSLVC